MTTRVALVGANGFGLHHRRAIAPLARDGAISIVAMCDVATITDEPGAPLPPETTVFTDHRTMMDAVEPDVVIVATPPHTHLDIALAALNHGADVLVEKPPVLSLEEHDTLCDVVESTRRYCQVGFQALGSAALAELSAAIRQGSLGAVTGIASYGAWQRPDSYYSRASWAGRRDLNGRRILDGTLVNPFAHSVMQCLAVAEACGESVEISQIELERFRARPIDVDDTAVARLRLSSGLVIVIAATLCADEVADPVVVVKSEGGDSVHHYTSDHLQLPADRTAREVPGRIGLLENLLAHRADPDGVPLLGDIHRTRRFTQVAEAFIQASPPVSLDAQRLSSIGDGPERIVTVPGVSAMVRDAADNLALPSELTPPFP